MSVVRQIGRRTLSFLTHPATITGVGVVSALLGAIYLKQDALLYHPTVPGYVVAAFMHARGVACSHHTHVSGLPTAPALCID
jgi:hypothetical protein